MKLKRRAAMPASASTVTTARINGRWGADGGTPVFGRATVVGGVGEGQCDAPVTAVPTHSGVGVTVGEGVGEALGVGHPSSHGVGDGLVDGEGVGCGVGVGQTS